MEGLLMRAAILLALLSTGCVDIVGSDIHRVVREEKHFSPTGKPEVVLSTFDGSIEIRPWDRPDVQVVVEKRGRDEAAISSMDVHVEQSGNRVVVDVKAEKRADRGFHLTWNFGRSANLIVSLPAESDVTAKSGDGSIDVERISGKVDLRSGDGSIRARNLTGDVNATTGDGSMTLEGKFGALRAHSGDGTVRIHAAPGSTAASDWDISTGDGSITLEIPDGFGAELDAHTGDGRIHVNDVTLSNVTGEIGRNTVRGRLGSGGSAVRLRTGDGSITLRRS
jgi:DUF4097 and DUF4098 domain-containing protein YvlB